MTDATAAGKRKLAAAKPAGEGLTSRLPVNSDGFWLSLAVAGFIRASR